jgi:uncharacterized membrane protein
MTSSRIIREVLIALTAGLGGLALGHALSDRPSQPSAAMPTEHLGLPAPERTGVTQAAPDLRPINPAQPGAMPSVREARDVRGTAATEGEQPTVREQELAERLRTLEKQLAIEKELRAEAGGKPIKTPDDVPKRFSQDALLAAARSAVLSVNPQAEVTSIDCTEYPCITYASGLGVEHLKALRGTSALAAYQQDDVSTLILNGVTGIMVTPRGPLAGEDQDNANRRVMYRFQEMALSGQHR